MHFINLADVPTSNIRPITYNDQAESFRPVRIIWYWSVICVYLVIAILIIVYKITTRPMVISLFPSNVNSGSSNPDAGLIQSLVQSVGNNNEGTWNRNAALSLTDQLHETTLYCQCTNVDPQFPTLDNASTFMENCTTLLGGCQNISQVETFCSDWNNALTLQYASITASFGSNVLSNAYFAANVAMNMFAVCADTVYPLLKTAHETDPSFASCAAPPAVSLCEATFLHIFGVLLIRQTRSDYLPEWDALVRAFNLSFQVPLDPVFYNTNFIFGGTVVNDITPYEIYVGRDCSPAFCSQYVRESVLSTILDVIGTLGTLFTIATVIAAFFYGYSLSSKRKDGKGAQEIVPMDPV